MEQLESSSMDKKTREKIGDILEDPTKSGIDFTEPVYCYVSLDVKRNSTEVGVVGSMASEGDLTDLFDMIAKEGGLEDVEKAHGAHFVEIDRNAAFIYNDEWFYAGQVKNVEDMIDELKERVSGKGSLLGNEAFDRMNSKEGVAQMLYQGKLMDQFKDMPEMEELMEIFPDDVEFKDIAGVVDLALNAGELVMTGEAVPMSKGWKDYCEKYDKKARKIAAEQTKYISNNGLSMFVNLDVSGLYEDHYKHVAKSLGMDKESLGIVEKICNTLTGQASFTLFDIEDNMPRMALYAGTSDGEALDMLMSMAGDENVKKNDDGQYVLPIDYDYEWDEDGYEFTKTPSKWGIAGFKDGQTYLTTRAEDAFAVPASQYATEVIKGKGFYARFNFGFLKDLAEKTEDEDTGSVLAILAQKLDYVECYYDDGLKSVFRIATTDKDKNPLQVLIDFAMSMMG